MTQAEDLIRYTTRALAGTVQAVRPLQPLQPLPQASWPGDVPRRRGWLFPLAAAASVVVIALASVIGAHLAGGNRTRGGTAAAAQAQRPDFYMTATYPASGPNVLLLQVRRTDGGAVTASKTIPAANIGWGGNITAAADDRAFFIGYYPCRSDLVAVTTFYRISITDSGRITGMAPVGHVQGMLTELAISPDGSRMAYSALPGKCGGFRPLASDAVGVLSLSTGAVRTWQNTAKRNFTAELSWAPDGRTLVVDERLLGGAHLTVYGLNTASSGGSLQAHSTTLLQQDQRCPTLASTCMVAVLAGPHNSLTALEYPAGGQSAHLAVVSIPLAAGHPQTILFSEPRPAVRSITGAGLVADPSGQWPLLWPDPAGWISGGQLHPLPGVGQVFPQGIAW